MTWPFAHLLEAWRIARADRLFPTVVPVAALVARMADQPEPYFNEVPAVVHDKLATIALTYAVSCIGQGETEGNNRGPFIRDVCHPAKDGNNWCAAFAGYCYDGAAQQLRIDLPFARSLGAKRLGANVAAVGRKFTDPAEARPGDLMVFHRGAQGSWMGHVGLVEEVRVGYVATIEGNSAPKVMRRMRRIGEERDRFNFFASLRR
jgi:hypothetical protein